MSTRKTNSPRAYRLSAAELERWDGVENSEAPERCEIRRAAINKYPDANTIELRAPDGAYLDQV